MSHHTQAPWRPALAALAFALALATAGCKETRNAGGPDTGAEAAPEAAPTAAAQTAPVDSPDLKHYPMPETLPGEDLVVAGAQILPEMEKAAAGGVCPVTVTARGDTTEVTILSMDINCCTERVRPSLEVADGTAEVRIWEYMTDLCECFHRRAVRFRLAPFDPAGLTFRVYANDRLTPCGEGVAPTAGGALD